jgi:RNA polymerase-binding transcription factor
MTAEQRDQLHDELIDRLTAIYQKVRADLSAAVVSRAVEDPSDEAEESTIDELRSLAADLGDRDRELAHAIEDALRRMSNDDFGICIDCGEDIPFERLRAVPWTLRRARDEARFEHSHQQHPPTL